MGNELIERRQGDWPRPKPVQWECPRCGSAFLVAGLAATRCATCGFVED